MPLIAALLAGSGVYAFVICVLLLGSGAPLDVGSQRKAEALRRQSIRPPEPENHVVPTPLPHGLEVVRLPPRDQSTAAVAPFSFVASGDKEDIRSQWRRAV